MTPSLRQRGGHGNEKTTIKGKARVEATNKASSGRRRLCGKPTSNVLPSYPTEARNKKKMTFDDLFGSDFVPVPGDESEEDVRPDRKTAIEAALAKKANCKIRSEEAFISLNHFLMRNGFSAVDPYKQALLKLLHGEAIDRGVREEIFKFIQEELRDVQQFFFALTSGVKDWDDTVAGFIVDTIREVTEHLGVEVTELTEISRKAEGIFNESERGFKVAKGDYVQDLIRSWRTNTHGYSWIARKWVDNPTASFSTCDPDTFDDRFIRRYQ